MRRRPQRVAPATRSGETSPDLHYLQLVDVPRVLWRFEADHVKDSRTCYDSPTSEGSQGGVLVRSKSKDSLKGEVLLYRAEDGLPAVDVVLDRETVWLSLAQIARLFGRDKSVISRHLSNVFRSGELRRGSVVAENATTAADGKTYQVEYFSLDAILSVGYRVNSKRGTQFRIWATRTLKDHLVKGYTVNRQRLEQNAKELEAALTLIRKTANREVLSRGRGPRSGRRHCALHANVPAAPALRRRLVNRAQGSAGRQIGDGK